MTQYNGMPRVETMIFMRCGSCKCSELLEGTPRQSSLCVSIWEKSCRCRAAPNPGPWGSCWWLGRVAWEQGAAAFSFPAVKLYRKELNNTRIET